MNTSKLQKALYLYNMNRFKKTVTEETKLRHKVNILQECLDIFENNDDIYWNYMRNKKD